MLKSINLHDGLLIACTFRPCYIVRKAGKRFKKSQKFNVMDLIENDMGGPYAPSVPCTVHKNGF